MESKPVLETRTAETVTISRAEYEELQELKKQNEWLLEQLRVIKSKLFGSSSEKASEELIGQLSLLFNEPEVLVEKEKAAEEPAVEVRAHTRQRKSGSAKDILPENTEVVETRHTLPEEERACPQCGEVMQPIGTEVRERIEIIPAKVILHRDIYETYACENCKKNDVTTPVPPNAKGTGIDPRQLCFGRGCCAFHGTEVCNGLSAVPSGAGMEPAGLHDLPADHVQLDAPQFGRLADACL